jgi:hypothetical protein
MLRDCWPVSLKMILLVTLSFLVNCRGVILLCWFVGLPHPRLLASTVDLFG